MANETHGTEAAGHAAEKVGMPQLDFATFPNQIFWLVVTLVIIYFVLKTIALPRISSVLSERQGTITNDISAAEDLKQQAVEAEEAYNQALADARVAKRAALWPKPRRICRLIWIKPSPRQMPRLLRKRLNLMWRLRKFARTQSTASKPWPKIPPRKSLQRWAVRPMPKRSRPRLQPG